MSNFRWTPRAVLLIFSEKHFDLNYRELKSFLSLSVPSILPLSALVLHLSLVLCSSYSQELLGSALFLLSWFYSFLFAILSFAHFAVALRICFGYLYMGIIGRMNTRIMLSYFTPSFNCCSLNVAAVPYADTRAHFFFFLYVYNVREYKWFAVYLWTFNKFTKQLKTMACAHTPWFLNYWLT